MPRTRKQKSAVNDISQVEDCGRTFMTTCYAFNRPAEQSCRRCARLRQILNEAPPGAATKNEYPWHWCRTVTRIAYNWRSYVETFLVALMALALFLVAIRCLASIVERTNCTRPP